MFKIIAGKYRGFKLTSVSSFKTRTTSHLVRKALFDTIGNSIEGNTVLDLFAGSGACGFEALSRNAQKIFLVDNSFLAFKTIIQNQKKLNLNSEQVKIFYGDAFKFLNKFNQDKIIFDLIILDPPYFSDLHNILFANLNLITNNQTLIVLETYHKTILNEINHFYLAKSTKYGNKKLNYYRKKIF